ncbi:hypothetical protein [Terrabacter sp. 2YAF2]|uniref:hypothetical protein n=1 Tax=Terrabacter sp. 2YAF2 TaxID=3233026 RepID=UPI003F99CE3A
MIWEPQWTRAASKACSALLVYTGALTLAGCETVAGAGLTGMTVDERGRPVVVFALCNDHIDGATIYRDRTAEDPKGEDSSISVAEWKAASPVTPNTALKSDLNTADPSDSWSRTGPHEAMKSGTAYVAYGWTSDNSWFTGHVEFTLARLSTLKPGQVLSQTYVQTKDNFVDTVQTYAQFQGRRMLGAHVGQPAAA